MRGDESHDASAQGALWVFGYGSLVWRPAFPYERCEPAVIHDWCRRFWQGSIDHRGMPAAPGRVATLVPCRGGRCWGAAYLVERSRRGEVLQRLDVRERGGYERHWVRATLPRAGEQVEALVYLAGRDNPQYLGPAPLAEIAAQVRRCHGPSGPNEEYVTELARALREMGADDPHVYDLEALL